jgi:L-iditol 2-dehydrogenase/L-gulonate 5-dehydrogenase
MEIRDFQIPEPGPDEARLRLLKAGICGSDLHIYAGHFNGIPYPLTTGHEGLGIIDKCGANVASERLGERVVIEPNFPCLECRYCKRGQGNICPRKRIFGVRETGCFAEYAVVPARFLWKVPASISNDDAILIEPSAVALHAIKMCSAEPGSTIAVIGLGAIGLLVVQIALALGYQVVVHDKIPLKMGLPERWGAKKVVESSLDVLNAAFTEADVLAVIETAGSADGTRTAIESAPRGAKVVLVGLALEPIQITAMPLTRNGTQIFTSMIYDHPQDFRQVIDLISNGRFFPSQIISSRVTLEGLPRTIDMLLKQTMETKIVVDFE